ncbi:MAG: Sec-independent protein translocase protein TatB [Pseudomonadales bacterium]
MFDIGFQELLLLGVISLLIMGPERLPGAVRTASLWLTRLRHSFQQIKTEIEREVGADEIKQQLHNESIMQSLEQTKSDLQDSVQHITSNLKPELDTLPDDINNSGNPEATDSPLHSKSNTDKSSIKS